VVNRSPDRVLELQKEFPDLVIKYEPMDRMWDVIGASDVVYPSTASMTTIIDPEPLAACMAKRLKRGGLQFVDISVPRNVHPDCGNIDHVHSYNVDHLKLVVERNTAKRRREMIEAEGTCACMYLYMYMGVDIHFLFICICYQHSRFS
jgi:glutamyl-tRNA reductase